MDTKITSELVEIFMKGLNELEEEIKKAFGKSLKELRAHTGITQGELSEMTRVPRQSLSVYERGEVAPTITQAFRIALVFGLDMSDFIEYGMDIPKELRKLEYGSITELYDAVNKE